MKHAVCMYYLQSPYHIHGGPWHTVDEQGKQCQQDPDNDGFHQQPLVVVPENIFESLHGVQDPQE